MSGRANERAQSAGGWNNFPIESAGVNKINKPSGDVLKILDGRTSFE